MASTLEPRSLKRGRLEIERSLRLAGASSPPFHIHTRGPSPDPCSAGLKVELGPESQPGMSMPDQDWPACPEVRPGSQPITLPPVPGILHLTSHTWGQGGAWDGLGRASAEASAGRST